MQMVWRTLQRLYTEVEKLVVQKTGSHI